MLTQIIPSHIKQQNKMIKKTIITVLTLLLFIPTFAAKKQKQVKLPAGTIVTIRTIKSLTSHRPNRKTTFVVNGDVWDEKGEVILIKEGTPADVQIFIKKASYEGDNSKIQFQPISTKAFNGRLIGFNEQLVVFSGGHYGRSKKVKLPAGTSFRGCTANDLYFNIEVDE